MQYKLGDAIKVKLKYNFETSGIYIGQHDLIKDFTLVAIGSALLDDEDTLSFEDLQDTVYSFVPNTYEDMRFTYVRLDQIRMSSNHFTLDELLSQIIREL